MISVQYPHFAAHPFYVMADPAISQAMPNLQKMASQENFSSGSETRAKQSTPGAKRRPSRAGTRSVSTLTAAQLERKRANDREAQRAIRQRTKDHIENLERQIAELSATNDTSAKLMQALQRNEELEQENALLRSRLNHAVAAMSESGM
jgi:DNA repair exonuclease SbcCD ATPase subunit